MQFLNAFTVDVEDYFQVSAFEYCVDRSRWSEYESRVVKNTQVLLDLLDKHNVQGTFFVLGWTAERFPQLVESIASAGHELGSHSYWHRLIYEQTPDEFRDDLIASQQAIESITGRPVIMFRAPSFSITKQSLWALDVLAEQGVQYDSSIFPVHHDRYGIPGASADIHSIATKSGEIWEFPPSVVKLGKLNVPVAGGGYFRLYPLSFTTKLLSRIHRMCRRPFMFYVHPWEVDPDQPRINVCSRRSRFRHYVNLHSTYSKLDRLLARFRFGRLTDVLQNYQPQGALA